VQQPRWYSSRPGIPFSFSLEMTKFLIERENDSGLWAGSVGIKAGWFRLIQQYYVRENKLKQAETSRNMTSRTEPMAASSTDKSKSCPLEKQFGPASCKAMA
jgi:hypothetical protein